MEATLAEYSLQRRLEALRATKLRHTLEKQQVIGAMDHDDHALILPPPERLTSYVVADGFDLASREAVVPVGLTCRLCERTDCEQRAFPPLQHPLDHSPDPAAYLQDSHAPAFLEVAQTFRHMLPDRLVQGPVIYTFFCLKIPDQIAVIGPGHAHTLKLWRNE